MSSNGQLRRVSTRVDSGILKIVERVAADERMPVSAVVRIALEDWAAERSAKASEAAA